jgi:hypothetical protein
MAKPGGRVTRVPGFAGEWTPKIIRTVAYAPRVRLLVAFFLAEILCLAAGMFIGVALIR